MDQMLEVLAAEASIDQMDIAESGDLFWFEAGGECLLDVDDGDLLGECAEDVSVDIGLCCLHGHGECFIQVSGDQDQGLGVVNGFEDSFCHLGSFDSTDQICTRDLDDLLDVFVHLQQVLELVGLIDANLLSLDFFASLVLLVLLSFGVNELGMHEVEIVSVAAGEATVGEQFPEVGELG